MDADITEDQLSNIVQIIHSSSICARYSLIQFEIVHRLHMSQVKLPKIFPGVSPICDRCKQATVTLYHTFWFCSSLTAFWSSIFEVYSAISGLTIDPCPFIGLFGVPVDDLPLQLELEDYIGLLSIYYLLEEWPFFGRWICDVMFFLKIEKIRYTINGSMGKFDVAWRPFISYVEQMTMHRGSE